MLGGLLLRLVVLELIAGVFHRLLGLLIVDQHGPVVLRELFHILALVHQVTEGGCLHKHLHIGDISFLVEQLDPALHLFILLGLLRQRGVVLLLLDLDLRIELRDLFLEHLDADQVLSQRHLHLADLALQILLLGFQRGGALLDLLELLLVLALLLLQVRDLVRADRHGRREHNGCSERRNQDST